MNINIRQSILENFKGSSCDEIRESINSSLIEKEEITLPGLGVLFEILWEHCDEDLKQTMLQCLKQEMS